MGPINTDGLAFFMAIGLVSTFFILLPAALGGIALVGWRIITAEWYEPIFWNAAFFTVTLEIVGIIYQWMRTGGSR